MAELKIYSSKVCLYCRRLFNRKKFNHQWESIRRYKIRRFCSHRCWLHWNSGNKHYNWKNGIAKYKIGYIVRSKDKKGIHRILMEEYLKRPLEKWEVVHHINGDRSDNRLENLKVMSWEEHARLHSYEGHEKRWGFQKNSIVI